MQYNSESVHMIKLPLCEKTAVPPRSVMAGFREHEVQRKIENYAHIFNFTLQQNKLNDVSLERTMSVVSQVLRAYAPPSLSCSTL